MKFLQQCREIGKAIDTATNALVGLLAIAGLMFCIYYIPIHFILKYW